ncbi:MAG: hypothetical protein ACKVX9_11685 [Blastocatellia bacterium]
MEVILTRPGGLALLFAASRGAAWAQCAMCKANLAHADNPAGAAKSINAAILILLLPTLLIIGGLIRMIYQYRNFQNDHVHYRSSDTERHSQ